MKKMSYYIKKYWYIYLIAIICMAIATALDMMIPQITRKIIDDVISNGNTAILMSLLISMIVICLIRFVFQYTKDILFDYGSMKSKNDMRLNLFFHLQKLSVNFYDKNNTGELMARMMDDINNMAEALGFIGMFSAEAIIYTSTTIYFMFTLSPKLTIVPLIILPIIALLTLPYEKKLGKTYGEISEENAAINTIAEENLAGVRTVKAFAREKFEIEKFLSRNKRYYDLNMEQSRILVKYDPYFQFISKIFPIITIFVGGALVINNSMTVGELAAFVAYSVNIVWYVEMMGWLMNAISSALASQKKIKKIYDETPSVFDGNELETITEPTGKVEFRNVSYQIGEKKILEEISFTLEAEKTLGIMGATGSGKTTIVNLLERFYDATSGEILIDDVNIRKLSLEELREAISHVMQDVFLFSDTIEENVGFGDMEHLTDDKLMNSVDNAKAKDFVERLSAKYETIIGEKGVGLSGGQKQRLSVARAFAKYSPILVLDDSTSAVDMETEHAIQKTLEEIKGMSKIVVTHRISAVRNADEIIFLEDGMIAERGTHKTLMKRKGLYYDTYIAQYGEDLEVDICQ